MSTENSLPQKRIKSALERSEAWARLQGDERKRKCAEAVRDGDRDALEAMFESYLRNYSRPGHRISDHTWKTYRRGMRKLMDWCADHGRKAHQVDENHARRFRTALQDELSDKTVATYLTRAKQFHAALRWCGLAEVAPFQGISVQERTFPQEKAQKDYTVKELKRLLSAARARGRDWSCLPPTAACGSLRLPYCSGKTSNCSEAASPFGRARAGSAGPWR